MRRPGAGARRGVELPHVVARLVLAKLSQLRARPDPWRPVVAGDHARRAADEREVERLDQARRHRPGTLTARRRRKRRCAHAAASTSAAGAAPGSTASST